VLYSYCQQRSRTPLRLAELRSSNSPCEKVVVTRDPAKGRRRAMPIQARQERRRPEWIPFFRGAIGIMPRAAHGRRRFEGCKLALVNERLRELSPAKSRAPTVPLPVHKRQTVGAAPSWRRTRSFSTRRAPVRAPHPLYTTGSRGSGRSRPGKGLQPTGSLRTFASPTIRAVLSLAFSTSWLFFSSSWYSSMRSRNTSFAS